MKDGETDAEGNMQGFGDKGRRMISVRVELLARLASVDKDAPLTWSQRIESVLKEAGR